MERQRNNITKEVDAILTADWHLRLDTPICRTDNFPKTEWGKVDFISALQRKYQCPVFHAGDLFDKWNPSAELLSEASKHMPENFFSVYGNHDTPQHNLELVYKCGLYNLMINGKVSVPQNGHWNQSLGDGRTGWIVRGRQLTMQHIMTYQGLEPWPGCTDPKAAKLLRKYPQFDLILTGDNHQAFVEEHKGRLLVNPGSIFRMDADQIDFKPRVYLWHAADNTVTPIYIPIVKESVSREHLDVIKERENRIDAFISKLNGDWKISMSFEDNLEQFKKLNKVKSKVMTIIYDAL